MANTSIGRNTCVENNEKNKKSTLNLSRKITTPRISSIKQLSRPNTISTDRKKSYPIEGTTYYAAVKNFSPFLSETSDTFLGLSGRVRGSTP